MRKVKLVLGLGIVLGVVGGTFLAAFGVLYVKPYMEIRTMERGLCVTVLQELHGTEMVRCHCADDGSTCLSKYPCLRVWVNLTTSDGVLHSNVTLYDSHETFGLQATTLQCSYHKCDRDPRKNLQAVEAYSNLVGDAGTQYECYYEPSDRTYAIKAIVTKVTIIHCMLWPSLALLIGFIILLVYLNDPSQAQHHFNSLERPWLRQQTRYECIVNPGEANAAAAISSPNNDVSAHAPQQSRSTQNLATSSSTPVAQLI
ncbi:hypothetical protein LSH36_892g00013 [Paralvinella palmiformis]|uniref:Uncharacterized protein n=1 Tax=Paralvinella palmiformis TaxID=53620 RepID=A0AAD9IYB4_9ANNE|nr:hypothetical protein LSH36_892g00013 [Paralvinella palmiformis]